MGFANRWVFMDLISLEVKRLSGAVCVRKVMFLLK
jgi:hypothetical protein